MAHSLGGYLDLPHGMCNALLLPAVIRYNYPGSPDRYDIIGSLLGANINSIPKEDHMESVLKGLSEFYLKIGFCTSLSDLGVLSNQIPELRDKAMKDACMVTNPRKPIPEDILKIYESAL
jgi:alcohol dehydrogenase class IV